MKYLPTLLLAAVLVTGISAQETPAAPPAQADVDYAFGVLLAQSLKSTGLPIDLDVVSQAMKDAFAPGGQTKFDAEQAKQVIGAALDAVRAQASAAQINAEKDYLKKHASQAGVKTTASGLQYEVISEGNGARPVASDTVKVDYVGTFTDGSEFDSSIQRGEPAVFRLDQVIAAWTEGLQLMTVGSKYRFTIPSSLAYGADGAGGVIPPYATLQFEVTLLSVEPPQPEEAAPAN